jgi:hypothetical protein
LCVSGEKCLQTIWDEITFTSGEDRRIKEGIPKETVVKESFWWMRPDGIVVLPPVGNMTGTFCILEHKRMCDVCERYLVRAKSTSENKYGDTTPRLEGRTDQLYHGHTVSGQTRPQQKPKVF